jgi:ribosomal protein S18 acetylase RimI-like enzyme
VELRRAAGASVLSDFRTVGEACFHVPPQWFAEVFNDEVGETCPEFKCWVAYLDGLPVATAATLVSDGVIGLYNIATVPAYRGRGIAEAMTRNVIEVTRAEAGPLPLILQATSLGLRMYSRLGFRETTRILVFNSTK